MSRIALNATRNLNMTNMKKTRHKFRALWQLALLPMILIPAAMSQAALTWSWESVPSDVNIKNNIAWSMDTAVAEYNTYSNYDGNIVVRYNSGVPTAQTDGFMGWIEFGGSISPRVASHELAHWLGCGTYWAWGNYSWGGGWHGNYAIARIKAYDGPNAGIGSDTQHFWPYGWNYDGEGPAARHIGLVGAMRHDMGLSDTTLEQATGPQLGNNFYLVNVGTGKCLDNPGSSTVHGTFLDQAALTGGANQQWTPSMSGYNWVLANVASGLAADDYNWSTTAGTLIDQWDNWGGAPQQWTLFPVGDGSYKIINSVSGMLMEVANGSNQIDQWSDTGSAKQHWTVRYASTQLATLSRLTVSPSTVVGGGNAVFTIAITQPALPYTAVSLSSSDGGLIPINTIVWVPDGTKTATFTLPAPLTDSKISVVVKAGYLGQISTVPLNIVPASLNTVAVSPNPAYGGNKANVVVSLTGKAGPSGVKVALSSSDGTTIPSGTTVTVPAGSTSATYSFTSAVVAADKAVTITATQGTIVKTAAVTIKAAVLTALTTAAGVTGGQTAPVKVTLSSPAPAGGLIITVASSSSAVSVAPGSISIPAGATTGTLTASTTGVNSDTAVTLTATCGSVIKTAPITVKAAILSAMTISPSAVYGGTKVSTTVTLTGKAGASGVKIALSSSDGSMIPAGTSVTVPGGATSAIYAFTPAAVPADKAVTITATQGSTTKSAVVTVKTPILSSLAVSTASVINGHPVTIKVILTSPAPVGGNAVALQSSSSTLPVPSTITVPAGLTTASITATAAGAAASTTATITASLNGVSKSVNVTVKP